jgi:hypothetical protein
MKSKFAVLLMAWICAFYLAKSGRLDAQDFARMSFRSVEVSVKCSKDAGIYSRDRNRCSYQDMVRQARLTERAYRAARTRAGEAGRRSFAASQRVWKESIDRQCHARDLFGPTPLGTDEIDEYLDCFAMAHIDRITWLERQYRRPHGRVRPAH